MTEEPVAPSLWTPDGEVATPETIPLSARIPWAAVGATVPFAVGVAYSLTFLWEYAYASHFRIPRNLIIVEPSLVLARALPVVLGSIMAAWLLGSTILWVEKHSERRRRVAVLLVVFLALFFVPLSLATHQTWRTWLLSMCILPGWWTLKFVYRRARGQRAPVVSSNDRSLAAWTARHVGASIVLTLIVFVYLAIIFFMWGLNDARNQRRFLVVDDADLVVLAIYGKLAVAAPFPEKRGELEGALHLLQLDDGPMVLSPRHVGPLRPRS